MIWHWIKASWFRLFDRSRSQELDCKSENETKLDEEQHDTGTQDPQPPEPIEKILTPPSEDQEQIPKPEKKPEKKPHKKGGMRRRKKEKKNSSKKRKRPKRPKHQPQPEFICRLDSMSITWRVFVSVEDETDCHETPVELFTDIVTKTGADGKAFELNLFAKNSPVAIFKMATDWCGDGRKVEYITNGYYIVIAPENYTQRGHVPHEKELCSDSRYNAFYFHYERDKDTTGTFGFDEFSLPNRTPRYKILGKSLFDSSDKGLLYIYAVPKLETDPEITWVRIGEERDGGWKGKNFKPQERSIKEMLNERQGRFFIRVYNAEVKLVDSGEFRYVRDLREIRVNNELFNATQVLLPGPEGYTPATISLLFESSKPESQPLLTAKTAHATVSGNTISVDPCADADNLSCLLENNGFSVEVELNLPRIWWRLEQENSPPDDWQSTSLVFTRDQFCQFAMSGASVNLRLPSQIKAVKVGLDGETDRSYKRDSLNNHVSIPLGHFVNYQQLDAEWNTEFTMSAQFADTVITLLTVPGKAKAPSPTREDSCCPLVKCGHAWRRGQGFSRGELQLALSDATPMSSIPTIAIDRRRRTIHQCNVNVIKELINV